MRGSSRCLKHGGRVEVPTHLHSVARFFIGDAVNRKSFASQELSDQEHWEQLPYRLKREVFDLLPPDVIPSSPRLVLAARVWMEVRDKNHSTVQRFIDTFVGH